MRFRKNFKAANRMLDWNLLVKQAEKLTKLQVLLWAREQLGNSLTQSLRHYKILAVMRMLSDEKAEDFNQVDE
jgi:hypothetical protein